MEPAKYFRFDAILLQQGWIRPGYVATDAKGNVTYLSDRPPADAAAVEVVKGVVLPGFPNGHSHAFQYAMAGAAEKHPPASTDDFWSWRELMYEHALRMMPDQMEAVATKLYAEMLRRGYTHVVEFHYLHHDVHGRPYANSAEMGERLVAAAANSGIRITLVPVFYQKGGFGLPAEPRQRRFLSPDPDAYLRLLDESAKAVKHYSLASLGFGVHSLRAVGANEALRIVEDGPRNLPFHLHAAEQLREVEDCVSYLGQRPVEWLLDNLPLNDRFNIVHCTHLNDDEVQRLAQCGAGVVLCPGTEGNLGDGIFRLTDFSRHYGNLCIGTDSHISLNPLEDLRWLDYAQRLITHRRNTFDDGATVLLNKVIPCGRRSAGIISENFFVVGKPFDGVVVHSPVFLDSEHLLSSIVYTADSSNVMGTIVNAKWVVKNQQHFNAAAIQTAFEHVMRELWQG